VIRLHSWKQPTRPQ